MTQRTTSYIRFDPSTRVVLSERYTEKNGEPTWVLSGGLSYYIGKRRDECWVYVPNNYRITGANVPDIFKSWIKPCDVHGQAVIIHHYLCTTGKIRSNGFRTVISKREANDVFLEAMKILGVPWWKRNILYWAACWHDNGDELPEMVESTY